MSCPRGCCASYREHIASIGLRARNPAPKQTVDVTDDTTNTVTEHWDDRQDVHIHARTLRTPPTGGPAADG
jgi:hypothetical protein